MKEKLFVEQAIKRVELERFLKSQLEDAGFTKSDIVKTPLVTRIVVNVTRPGLAIGKSGQNIKSLTDIIQKKYGIENPQLEIREITNPNLDAAAVANKLKALIERGYSWRSVAYKTLKDIMGAGAQGVEIIVSGKLQGKGGRKKKQRIAAGYMKKVGYQTKFVDYAKSAGYPKQGAIGIKVRIVKPDTQFADKVEIMQFLEQRKSALQANQKTEAVEGAATGQAVPAIAAGEATAIVAAAGPEAMAGAAEQIDAEKINEKKIEAAQKGGKKEKPNVQAAAVKAHAVEAKTEHKEKSEGQKEKDEEHKGKKGGEEKGQHTRQKESKEKGDKK